MPENLVFEAIFLIGTIKEKEHKRKHVHNLFKHSREKLDPFLLHFLDQCDKKQKNIY